MGKGRKRVGKSVHNLSFLGRKNVKVKRCGNCGKALHSENKSGLCVMCYDRLRPPRKKK